MPNEPIHIAQSKEAIYLLPKMANRHGLIAGATGTGKTVTLQTLAENFSARGVPVFMADVKGDLAGLSQPGANNPKVVARAQELKIADFKGEARPGRFLGRIRRAGASRARDGVGDGPAAARTFTRVERHAGRRAQHGV